MSDPQKLGLDELGQRAKDPVAEPRLRPYSGNSRSTNPYEAYEDLRVGPLPPPLSFQKQAEVYSQPAAPEPFTPTPYSDEPYRGYARTATPAPSASSPTVTETSATSSRQPNWVHQDQPTSTATSTNGAGSTSAGSASTGSASTGSTNAGPTDTAQPASETKAEAATSDDPNAPKSGLQRALDAIRSTLPLVQRLLPLLDGNFATVVSSLVASQPVHHAPPPPQVRVDLGPVERGLAELRTSQRDLRTQVVEQVTTLKRVEDQLEHVREATDRNTLEQQELVEDLRAVGSRLSAFAIVGLILLAASMALNVYFLVQLQHILR